MEAGPAYNAPPPRFRASITALHEFDDRSLRVPKGCCKSYVSKSKRGENKGSGLKGFGVQV